MVDYAMFFEYGLSKLRFKSELEPCSTGQLLLRYARPEAKPVVRTSRRQNTIKKLNRQPSDSSPKEKVPCLKSNDSLTVTSQVDSGEGGDLDKSFDFHKLEWITNVIRKQQQEEQERQRRIRASKRFHTIVGLSTLIQQQQKESEALYRAQDADAGEEPPQGLQRRASPTQTALREGAHSQDTLLTDK